jgi:hypothetical protein
VVGCGGTAVRRLAVRRAIVCCLVVG